MLGYNGKGIKYGPWFCGFRHPIRAYPVYEGGYCTQSTYVFTHPPTLRGGEEREEQKCAGEGKRGDLKRNGGKGRVIIHTSSLSACYVDLLHICMCGHAQVHVCTHPHTTYTYMTNKHALWVCCSFGIYVLQSKIVILSIFLWKKVVKGFLPTVSV